MSRAEPFVFADFSSLQLVGEAFKTASVFFIQTPAALAKELIELPISGIVHNGRPVEFQATFIQKKGGWFASINVVTSEVEPSSFAEFYLNLMFDVASIKYVCPFLVNAGLDQGLSDGNRFTGFHVSSILNEGDFDQSARIAFLFFTCEKDLSRSIGWYRRGISSSDSLFSFLGLWNSIETAAAKFCVKNEMTEKGSKNQIYQIFKDYLPRTGLSFFQDDAEMDQWIKDNYQMRLDIAHGLAATEISIFRRNDFLLPKLRKVATALLRVLMDARRAENPFMKQVLQQADERKKEKKLQKAASEKVL